jgi:hypothetical protein
VRAVEREPESKIPFQNSKHYRTVWTVRGSKKVGKKKKTLGSAPKNSSFHVMSAINVLTVVPENSLVPFDSPFAFAIEYECLAALEEDLEWKMIYVGSAESENYDQVLDSVLVGPVLAGGYKFIFEGNAPDPAKIPVDDLIGVTGAHLCRKRCMHARLADDGLTTLIPRSPCDNRRLPIPSFCCSRAPHMQLQGQGVHPDRLLRPC